MHIYTLQIESDLKAFFLSFYKVGTCNNNNGHTTVYCTFWFLFETQTIVLCEYLW